MTKAPLESRLFNISTFEKGGISVNSRR